MKLFSELKPKAHILNSLVLAALATATLLGLFWVWGLFFVTLSYLAYATEETFVMTPIRKSEAPILYWVASLFWLVIGASYLFLK